MIKFFLNLNFVACFIYIFFSHLTILQARELNSEDKVSVRRDTLEIPTYLLGPQEKYPIFRDYRLPGCQVLRSDRPIYPYTMQDEFSRIKIMKKYETIYLENKYIRVIIMPELRGRIQGAIDKRNGWDFLYYNQVIKPADISIRQAWISGGLEWNHPMGHGYTQFQRISHRIVEKPGGGKSVVVTEIEPNRKMKWEIEITLLYPDKLFVETKGKFMSIAPYPVPFVSAQNGAMHISDSTEIIFPKGTYLTGHGKKSMIKWPNSCGTDLSIFRNIQGTFSSFGDGQAVREDFFGCYSHEKHAGTVIVADHRKAPGKKFFTWGAHPGGRVWDTLLSDADGPYTELQLVAFGDNLGYGYSWLNPGETKEFTAYWYPVKNMDGYVKATRDICMNIKKVKDQKIKIALQATKKIPDAVLKIYANGKTILEKKTDLNLSEPYLNEFQLPNGVQYENIEVALFDKEGSVL